MKNFIKSLSFLMLIGVLFLSCQKGGPEMDNRLIQAVKDKDAPEVKKCLRRGGDPNAFIDEKTTVLHMAIYKHDEPTVRLLVDAGADLTIADESRNMPLTIAVISQEIGIISCLIEAGADVNHINNNRLHSTALMEAAFLNNARITELLIQNGADLDIVDIYDYSAVGFAAGEGALEATRILVEAGADLSLIGQGDMNILDVAILNNHDELANYLRSVGMTPYYYNKEE